MRDFRRALITGASSGIGSAFARALPAATDLMLTGRDQERLEGLAGKLAAPNRRIDIVTADLVRDDERDRLIAVAREFAPDLLINNAGTGRLGRFLDNDEGSEYATVMVNVVAVVVLTRALLPAMIARARGEGRRCGLIIVASAAAFAPVPLFASYAASKTFDLHFAEALAEDLRGEPVDVMALCPGATDTAFGERAGYGARSLPWASDPAAVAAGALAALGRETVFVSGLLSHACLAPIVRPRRLITAAIGQAVRALARRRR